jgi:hypothetical protein
MVSLEKGDVHAAPGECPSSREAGVAATDDGDIRPLGERHGLRNRAAGRGGCPQATLLPGSFTAAHPHQRPGWATASALDRAPLARAATPSLSVEFTWKDR